MKYHYYLQDTPFFLPTYYYKHVAFTTLIFESNVRQALMSHICHKEINGKAPNARRELTSDLYKL